MSYSFAEQLEMSHQCEDLPFWKEVYEKSFPGFVCMINHRQDGEHQRAGIDRSVILSNSKQILIDEKVRGRNKRTGQVYEDIALEFWSDFDRKVRGWVCKPLRCDYIAYAIAPLGRCYLLPVPALQNAWMAHGEEWVRRFNERDVYNQENGRRWTTKFCPVPVKVLYPAIGEMLRATFNSFECDE